MNWEYRKWYNCFAGKADKNLCEAVLTELRQAILKTTDDPIRWDWQRIPFKYMVGGGGGALPYKSDVADNLCFKPFRKGTKSFWVWHRFTFSLKSYQSYNAVEPCHTTTSLLRPLCCVPNESPVISLFYNIINHTIPLLWPSRYFLYNLTSLIRPVKRIQ